ncbi:MAG TPA: tyrosine-type recombinase/integrase [Roseateles sp.]
MPVVNITTQFLKEGLVCPPEKAAITFYCAAMAGFAINVSRGKPGRGLYRFQHKVNGKSTWEKLGSTDDTTLDHARAKALRFKEMKALAPKLPVTPIEAPKVMPTLNAFFKLHYKPYAKPRKRSFNRDEEMFRLRIGPLFGGMLLNEISRQAVQAFHASLFEGGLAPATADHHVKLLRFMLNLAVEWDMLEKNPITGIRLFNPDNKVEVLLSDEQLDRLVKVLEADRNRTVSDIALYLLSTGARLSEALAAKWEDIDLERSTWKVLAANAKSKKARIVPLNDSALMILKRQRSLDKHAHVFVNPQTDRPYTTMMKVWDRLRKQAGMPTLRIHDLRHTFASLLVANSRTLYQVQTILGHSDPKVTMRYSKFKPADLVEAAGAASLLKVPSLKVVDHSKSAIAA